MFGSLVKGLRIGIDLLLLLQKEEHSLLTISKFLKLPLLSGSDGLNEFLTQLEAAVDSDFPKYQVNFWEELEPSCFSKYFCLNPVERYCITDTLCNLFPITLYILYLYLSYPLTEIILSRFHMDPVEMAN